MIYLDYAATYPGVKYPIPKMLPVAAMNPNANYSFREREALVNCEEEIKNVLGVKTGHVLYFRCATDAASWLVEKFKATQDNIHIGHCPYEHNACCYGVELAANKIDDIYYKNLDVYFHQWVNQLTGQVFDLQKIKNNLPQKCFLLVDMTAGFGKMSLPDNIDKYADSVFMSGHKIGCPYLSFCWISDRLFRFFKGKDDIRNQYGLHYGSLTCDCIRMLSKICEKENQMLYLYQFRFEKLIEKLKTILDYHNINYQIVYPNENNSICSITLKGVNAEALQAWLSEKEIFIGVGGSACSESQDFRVLKAYGFSPLEAASTIRISFGKETTIDEVEEFANILVDYIRIYIK